MKTKLRRLLVRSVIIMSRNAIYFVILQATTLPFLMANNSDAQIKRVTEAYIDCDIRNAPLKTIFKAIERQTEYTFTYDESEIDINQKMNVLAQHSSVESVLLQISEEADLKFRQVNNNIHVKRKEDEKKPEERVEIMIQGITVTGRVTSAEDGEGLPGVNVILKGTQTGTVTDLDGNYQLDVPDESAVLVFSSVGYQLKEIAIGTQTAIDVVMYPDVTALEEIVVIGYGQQERREISSAISTVKSEAIENLPQPSVDALLQGRAAGVNVVKSSGAPGGGITVRIRGNTSIGGGNEPLYIVDGVPIRSESVDGLGVGNDRLNPTADINPNDIESIQILKDAASASIYGARASNGVILITTKSGKKGKARVDFNMYTGWQKLAKKLSVLNARQFREIKTEAFINENNANFSVWIWEDVTDSVGNPFYMGDTDWQEEMFDVAPITNVELSARGGGEELNYAISGGYYNQEGILINSGYERFTIRAKTDYKASERFRIGSNISFTRRRDDRVSTGPGNSSTLGNMFNTPPTYVPVFPDWPNIPDVGPVPGSEMPTAIATQPRQNAFSNRLIGDVYAELEIIDGLKWRSNVAADILSLKEDRFLPGTIFIASNDREATTRYFQEISWINENILTYDRTFNEDHFFNALAGFSQQEIKSESIFAQTSGSPSDIIPTLNAGSTLEAATSFITGWGIMSFFGRINYSFKDKYLVSGTVRRDGSSRFGQDNRYGTFPSISLAWRMSEEGFLRNSDFVNDFKWRASFGKTGNQDIPNFVAQGVYMPGLNYDGSAGIGPASNGLPNRALTWESTDQFDVGLDVTILKNRLTLIADYYVKNTDGLLFNIQIPETSGFTNLFTNLGEVQNKGFEIQALATIIDRDFKWSIDGNVAFNNNKIVSLPGGNDILASQGGVEGILREGEPMGSFYGYNFLGVYARDEDVPTGLKQNGFNVVGGYARFENLDGNDVIDPSDRMIIGNALPDYFGGFGSTFSYRGLSLNLLWSFSGGNQIMNRVAADRDGMAGFFVNPSTRILDRWQEQGDVTNVPAPQRVDRPGNFRNNSTYWLEDGSYLRLQNATLAYNFDQSLISALKLERARVYITGQNLLTFTDYSGYDPEVVSTSTGNTGIFGVDNYNYPSARTFIVGLSLGF